LRARRVLITLSSLTAVAAGLALAPPASADSVQVQSYQRANQSEACSAQQGETPWEAAWGADASWTPSWERWANNGTGGWVCSRSITWAHDDATQDTHVGCVKAQSSPPGFYNVWMDFGSRPFLPAGAMVFDNADCTGDGISPTVGAFVYTPTETEADGLCAAGDSPASIAWRTAGFDFFEPSIWACGVVYPFET
jgi:hypothetical protein